MQVILGDVCFPKSEILVIPSNTKGIMSKGLLKRVAKDGFKGIEKEAKTNASKKRVEVGDYFTTGPGRFKRRGTKKIYHAVIKRFPGDFSSSFIVEKLLNKIIKNVISEGYKSITLCGIGIGAGELDEKIIANIMVNVCCIYDDKIEIRIIDDNVDFINEVGKILRET
jgi:O-acetyl-ADP-ribose deacetylase (regulator of RNase III)